MSKNPEASRKAEQRDNEKSGLMTVKESGVKKGGFKKGGFKSAFAPSTTTATTSAAAVPSSTKKESRDSDDDIDYEYYDPQKPTGCEGGCGFQTQVS